jgi:heme exporter protein CcmD
MSEILNLGGYGGFIWSAWGTAFVVLVSLTLVSVRSMRVRERELAQIEAELPRRGRRRAQPAANVTDDASGELR